MKYHCLVKVVGRMTNNDNLKPKMDSYCLSFDSETFPNHITVAKEVNKQTEGIMGSIEEGVVTITKPNYPKRDGDHWSIDFVETVCRYEYISGREIV